MNSSHYEAPQSRWRRVRCVCAALGAIGALGALGCDDDEGDVALSPATYAYTDPYLYDYYYTGDLAYSSYYWADSWAYDDLYFSPAAQVVTGDGGVTQTQVGAIGSAIRALARGEQVCPGQVTVTPKTAAPACAATGVTEVRNGVTLVFNNCVLPGGGTLNGTADVAVERTASAPTCASDTTITLKATTTLTNVSYVSPAGGKLVIPNEVDTSSTSYTYGQRPNTITFNSTGELQTFDDSGIMRADHTFNGTRTFTFSGSRESYTINGTLNVANKIDGATAVLTGHDIKRTTGCCRPTDGTLTLTLSGGANAGEHTVEFGSTCGQVQVDGNNATLPACL